MRFADVAVPATAVGPDADGAEEMTYADFAGGRTVSGPLTWGQRAMWRSVDEFTSPAAYRALALPRTVTVPVRADVAVPRALRAVGALVTRHESLRTRFRRHDDEVRQEASAAGRLPVLVHVVREPAEDPDGRSAATALTARIREPGFDHVTEWPLRVALVTVDDRVRQVVVVFSHAVVDLHAAGIVLRDLRALLLRGALDVPPGPQSLEIAERERHAGVRRSERAIAYWIRQLDGLTPSLPDPVAPAGQAGPPGCVGVGSGPVGPEPDGPGRDGPVEPGRVGPASGGRFRRGALVSAAIRHAAQLVAVRHRVSTADALLAATVAVLAGDRGQDTCGIVVMANNRYQPGHGNAVATLNQIGLCRLELADRPDFAELLTRAGRAALDAYRHAYYDPAVWERTVTDLGHDHRTFLAPYCYLNDARLARDIEPGTPGADETELRALAAGSTVRWLPELERFPWRCRLQVLDAPGAVELVLTADTRYLPAERVEPLLRGIEAVLLEAAFHDLPWPWRTGGPASQQRGQEIPCAFRRTGASM